MSKVPGTYYIEKYFTILEGVVPWYLGTFVYNNDVFGYHVKTIRVPHGTVWGCQL